jgi:OmpA-OmpF porin, OOP family
MKFQHKKIFTGVSLAIALSAGPALVYAQSNPEGWYLGGNLGQTDSDLDDERTTEDLLGPNYGVTTIDDDKTDTGYKLFGGYQFNRNFALEAGYFDLGESSFTANVLPNGSALPGTFGGTTEVKGYFLDLVGTAHFNDKFSAFARVGANHARPEERFTGTGSVPLTSYSSSEWDTNLKYGVGLQYAFTPSWALRLEGERYRVQDGVANRDEITFVSLGLVYHFGKKENPVPVKTLPAVATPPATQEYCTKLEIEFEIDRDAVERAEHEKLSALGAYLNKYPNTSGTIEGRADPVGADEYNQKLSERRALNVIRYLEDDLRVANGRLRPIGYGESKPTTTDESDAGKRANRRVDAVISCATDIQGLTQVTPRISTAAVVHFDRNKADVNTQYRGELEKIAKFLKEHPTITATVEGHSDDGRNAQKVSLQRAQNVVKYLVDNFGVPANQLSAEGFGNKRRVAYNTSEEGRKENRRVNIVLNYPDPNAPSFQ